MTRIGAPFDKLRVLAEFIITPVILSQSKDDWLLEACL
jgi:hypothetical protein